MAENILVKTESLQDDDNQEKMHRSILGENISRLSIFAPILLATELLLFIMPDKMVAYSRVIQPFLLSNVVLVPAVFLVKRYMPKLKRHVINLVQASYALSVLLLGVFLALETMGTADFIHMYMMSMIGITTFITFFAWTRTITFAISLAAFTWFLPQNQPDPEVRFVIMINVLLFALLSWLLGTLMTRNRIRSYLDRQSLVAKSSELRLQAQRDSMTQLLNHEASFARLDEEINRAKRIGYSLTLIISDIDDFKRINDRYGHPSGDLVIKKIADIIREQVRTTDIVGRYGGEEYIMILPDTGVNDAKILIRRICSAIETALDEMGLPATLSGGISEYSGESVDDFIRLTDEKLYQAKDSGKNRFLSE